MKLDLHTHCMEATGMVRDPNLNIVKNILEKIKDRGLDGIAITEHDNKEYGYKIKQIIEEHFNNQILIIPGWEVALKELGWAELVELFLPDGSIFRFLPHPSAPFPGDDNFDYDINLIHGIEIGNALHDRQINKKRVKEISNRFNLKLLTNSDAHTLDDIGSFYNEITLQDLYDLSKITC